MRSLAKKFRNCKYCGRPLVANNPHTGKLEKAESEYPFCTPCLLNHSDNKNFLEWVKNKIYAKTSSGNTNVAGIKTE